MSFNFSCLSRSIAHLGYNTVKWKKNRWETPGEAAAAAHVEDKPVGARTVAADGEMKDKKKRKQINNKRKGNENCLASSFFLSLRLLSVVSRRYCIMANKALAYSNQEQQQQL